MVYNSDLTKYLDQIYPFKLAIKDTKESNAFASYLDFLCESTPQGPLLMTNLIVLLSFLQILVATSHLHLPMAFSFHAL